MCDTLTSFLRATYASSILLVAALATTTFLRASSTSVCSFLIFCWNGQEKEWLTVDLPTENETHFLSRTNGLQQFLCLDFLFHQLLVLLPQSYQVLIKAEECRECDKVHRAFQVMKVTNLVSTYLLHLFQFTGHSEQREQTYWRGAIQDTRSAESHILTLGFPKPPPWTDLAFCHSSPSCMILEQQTHQCKLVSPSFTHIYNVTWVLTTRLTHLWKFHFHLRTPSWMVESCVNFTWLSPHVSIHIPPHSPAKSGELSVDDLELLKIIKRKLPCPPNPPTSIMSPPQQTIHVRASHNHIAYMKSCSSTCSSVAWLWVV